LDCPAYRNDPVVRLIQRAGNEKLVVCAVGVVLGSVYAVQLALAVEVLPAIPKQCELATEDELYLRTPLHTPTKAAQLAILPVAGEPDMATLQRICNIFQSDPNENFLNRLEVCPSSMTGAQESTDIETSFLVR